MPFRVIPTAWAFLTVWSKDLTDKIAESANELAELDGPDQLNAYFNKVVSFTFRFFFVFWER
jgi:hypothetical protein